MNYKKGTICKILLFVVSATCVMTSNNNTVFAGAWVDYGGGGGPSGGSAYYPGGGTGNYCNGNNYIAECLGFSWIYYEYVGGDANKKYGIINFPHAQEGAFYTVGNPKTGDNCATYGNNTGFWHYGWNSTSVKIPSNSIIWNDYKNYSLLGYRVSGVNANSGMEYLLHVHNKNKSWSKKATNGAYNAFYDIGSNALGHMWTNNRDKSPIGSTVGYERVGGDRKFHSTEILPTIKAGNNAAQTLYILDNNGNKVKMYRAKYNVKSNNAQLLKEFKAAYKLANNNTTAYAYNYLPSTLSAFCYGDSMGDQVAKYTASTTASGNSGTIKTDKYSMAFTHTITRNNGDNFSADNKYKTNPKKGGTSLTGKSGTWTSTQVNAKSGNIIDEYKDQPIKPGESFKHCSSITYNSEIHSNGSSKNATSTEKCLTVKRNAATFTGKITATVKKNASKTAVSDVKPNITIELDGSDDGKYEIVFTHKISRNKDGAGGDVETYYQYKSKHDDAWSAAASSGPIKEEKTQTVKENTYTGTLDYGQQVTKCNSLQYINTQSGGTTYTRAANSEYCITIVRPKKACAINSSYEYGVNDGQNIGRVGLKNQSAGTSNYSWALNNSINGSTTIYTNADNYNDKDSLANIWLQPGDLIRFADQACAGAFYAIEKGNATGGVHYATEAKLIRNYGDSSNRQEQYNNASGTDGYLFDSSNSSHPRYKTETYSYKNPTNSTGKNLNSLPSGTSAPYATWTSGLTGTDLESSGFLSHQSGKEPIAEISTASSTSIATQYSPSTADARYNGSGKKGYYQTCLGASNCTFGQQEVGGVIYHRLSWNGVNVVNGVAASTTEHSAVAIAKMPYNYILEPYVENGSGDGSNSVLYLGGTKKMNPGVVVKARKNGWVRGNGEDGGATYATVTKETNFEITVTNASTGRVIYHKELKDRLNTKGGTKTHTDSSFVSKMFPGGLEIPVAADGSNKVGQQICTELKVWPIDSHEAPMATTVYGSYEKEKGNTGATEWALREDGRSTNSATAKSCSTIAKRPTMSVESSNAYSATNFTTSLYNKSFSEEKGNRHIFGSWSEYGVFGKVNTDKLFVSGAAVGYVNNTVTSNTVNSARDNSSSTNVAFGEINKRTCQFMTQTLVNSVDGECKSTDKNVGIGKSAAESFLNGILERYGGNKFGKEYDGAELTSAINPEDYRIESGNSNSIVAIYTNGDATLKSIPNIVPTADNPNPNRTIVYNIKGTLKITGNINDERNVSKSGLSDLTGVIIIAKNIEIGGKVSYINATIVAKSSLNTCESLKLSDLNSELCNTAIVFDAPVFTKKLILNRTAGADAATDSIRRAEIFNLNMADYLWSYYQMTNYNQATTTFSRELPSRY